MRDCMLSLAISLWHSELINARMLGHKVRDGRGRP